MDPNFFTMDRRFAIVKFPDEDDSLGVVALKWVSEDGTFSYYPNVYTNEKRDQLLRMEADYKDDWLVCPIQVMHKYGTYSEARTNLKHAEETSNLESDDENLRRKKKQKIIALPGEETNDDVVPSIKKHSTLMYPSLSGFQNNCEAQLENSDDFSNPSVSSQRLSNGNFGSVVSRSSVSTHSGLSSSEKLLGQLQATLADLCSHVQSVERKLDLLLAERGNSSEETTAKNGDHVVLLGCLPLKTMEDYRAFEEKLSEEQFMKTFIKVIITIGGNDYRGMVQNVMRRIRSDELATAFSYTGSSTGKDATLKIPFGTLNLCQGIHAAVMKIHKVTRLEVQATICL